MNSSLFPILGTGLKGLVGSKFVQVFSDTYSFENLDLANPEQQVDITNQVQVEHAVAHSPAEFIVHFAAFTDVTKAWEQRDQKDGVAYKVNVEGTEHLTKAATKYGKHFIHISTAYVFNGEKTEAYTEEDPLSPIEWYGQTKAWAEEVVQKESKNWTILRIDQPFRTDPFPKLDTAHRIMTGLQQGKLYPQFTDHYFGPTVIEEFAKVLDWVIRTKTNGLFHASSGEKWTDYDFAVAIQKAMNIPGEVKQGSLDSYLKTLNRPYQRNTALSTEKLKQLVDFKPQTVESYLPQLKSLL